MGEWNLADLFEQGVDAWGEREYLVANGKRRTYAEMEARANRLAHHLAAQGIGVGDHVGIYAKNSVEWVETLWAVFKLRAVWVNINYRYVEEELAYLFDNADLKALVYEPEYRDRVAAVRSRGNLPLLTHALEIGPEYEAALDAQSPERDFAPRSGDDLYILYTGGTTGMPKGVLWRHADVVFALGGAIDPVSGHVMTDPVEFRDKGLNGFPLTALPTAPLMHGASQWSVMGMSFIGNKVVLAAKFDAADTWRLVQDEKVNLLMITGDAMARPLLDELERPGAAYDTSSLFAISSTAALFSQASKDRFLERFPNLVISDAIGASETGSSGITYVTKGQQMKSGPTVKPVIENVVLDDDFRPVEPGSGQVGRVARMGHVPLGYYKDPKKSAETFVTGPDGTRYAIPGDFATVEADGSITLLGRGSVSINTGGEKVYVEEVENALKSHPAVFDAVVVGVPDERWGKRVAAVVQFYPGATASLDELQDECRRHIAGYKVPRQLTVVDAIVRSPSGKPDYRWAAATAEADAAPTP